MTVQSSQAAESKLVGLRRRSQASTPLARRGKWSSMLILPFLSCDGIPQQIKCISFRGDRTGSGFIRTHSQAASFQYGSFKIASELRILNSQEAVSTVAWSVINLIPLEDRPWPLLVPNLRHASGEEKDLKIKETGKVWVINSEPISMAAGGSGYS